MAHPAFHPIPVIVAVLASLPLMSMAESQKAQIVVTGLEGTARVQHPGKKLWESLSVGAPIFDNDIVETFFQTKLIAQFGKGNAAVLGSNSKSLFNIAEDVTGPKGVVAASFTLFSGGIFVRAVKSVHISVFTTNGVVDVDSGAVSTIVESKTGETGYQVFGGVATVRNIAQQKGHFMSAGQTTMVLPGREPTPALYLTNRHVSVLKHFFGDEYIVNELNESKITPTEDASAATSQVRLSQDLGSNATGRPSDAVMYRRLFSLDKIYEVIIRDQMRGVQGYRPVPADDRLYPDNRLDVGYRFDGAVAAGSLHQEHLLTPSFAMGIFDGGLRLAVETNASGKLGFYQVSSGLPGFLDLVDHVTVGSTRDSLFFHAGPIEDLTIGQGIVVSHFSNVNQYQTFHSLGISGQARLAGGIVNVQGFLGDAATFSPGGLYVSAEPGPFFLGAGGYIDPSPYHKPASLNEDRFVHRADTMPDTSLPPYISYEAALGGDVFTTQDAAVRVIANITQNLSEDGSGLAVRLPMLNIAWLFMQFGGGYSVEQGRTISGQFTWLYPTNAARVVKDSATAPAVVYTQNNILSPQRKTQGVCLYFRASPVQGLDLSLDYNQDLLTKHTLVSDPGYHDGDFSYCLRVAVNDSLARAIHFAELIVRQAHAALYPPGSLFPSWGLQFGLHVVTNPLLANIAVQGGLDYYWLDLTGSVPGYLDNRIGSQDGVLEWYAGLRWGGL